jgi:hypothetical protein
MEGIRILPGNNHAKNMGIMILARYISTGEPNNWRIKGFNSVAPIVRAYIVRQRSAQFNKIKAIFSIFAVRKVIAEAKNLSKTGLFIDALNNTGSLNYSPEKLRFSSGYLFRIQPRLHKRFTKQKILSQNVNNPGGKKKLR